MTKKEILRMVILLFSAHMERATEAPFKIAFTADQP
jgi:hypothetical protein